MMMNAIMTENNDTSTSSAYELKLRTILTATDAPKISDTLRFRKWFLQQFKQDQQNQMAVTADFCDCTLERFAVYFMYGIRRLGNNHLRTNEYTDNVCPTQTTTTTYEQKKPLRGGSNTTTENLERMAFPMLGTPTGRSFTSVQPRNASTPVRKNLNHTHQQQQPQQQQQHHQKHVQQHQIGQNQRRSIDNCNKSFDTKSNNSSYERTRNSTTGDFSNNSNSLCLGDFLTSPTTLIGNRHSSAQKKKQNSSSTAQTTPNSSSNNSNSNTNNTNTNSKPKKRVVPISVSKMSTKAIKDKMPFGTNSSFSQENNILSFTQIESKEFNKCAVAEAREALKIELSEVSSVIKATITTPTSTPSKKCISIERATSSMKNLNIGNNQNEAEITSSIHETQYPLEQPKVLLDKIPNEITKQLKMLACIYGLLIDMNLTTDVLNEISFLLNLLNAEIPLKNNDTKGGYDDDNISYAGIDLLKIKIYSIYFAKCALEEQQETLFLIDIKSLGVILQCERLQYLMPSLNDNLTAIYVQKQTFSTTIALHDVFSGLRNVCFQEDTDSRKFFRSNNEFGAFKTQRDLFYNALKFWEKHHLYPQFIFAIELAPKVRDIFRQSENSINMMHFSKLFVSQLLISATEQTSPEDVGIGMKDDIDLEKFNKLSQRLVAPSDFSVDFQFPREQAFFRDFIIESRSLAFIEHLKLILYSELIALNDSTFEHINIHVEDGYNDHHHQHHHQCECNEEESEFIVRPPILASMLILAKFLGFVTSLPFQGSTDIVQDQQLRFRRLIQPTFNICQILETAIKNKRHLITIPWIVQYLYMLDNITLQLDGFVEAINKLFTLYASLGNGELKINPTSAFIVRCCLGWLFEKHYTEMAYKYLWYRIEQNSKQFNHFISIKNQRKLNELQLKPILDATMCVACPFLAEFRVSIMPPKHAMAKYVSRTGRFRHITPCFATETSQASNQLQLNPITTTLAEMNENSNDRATTIAIATDTENLKSSNLHTIPKQRQKLLMDSFLHAQNTSMRRLIFFLIERVYKCVVKDAQNQILLPLKAEADKQANKITSTDKNMVYEQVCGIYQYARNEAHKQWDAQIPEMINKRTTLGLEHLLPNETSTIIKKAYAWRIRSEAKLKISQWMHMNLYKNDYYCNDMNELALKIYKSNINRNKNSNANANANASSQTQTTELKLLRSQPRISELIEELQHWLYTTGFETQFQPEIWWKSSSNNIENDIQTSFGKHDVALINFLERLISSFENTLPTIYYRLIGAGLLQLLQHLISISPLSMTNELIQAACEFFSNDKIRKADIAAPPSNLKERGQTTDDKTNLDNTNNKLDADNSEQLTRTDTGTGTATTTIYHALITAPFIESLGTCHVRFDKLKDLLIALIQSNVVTFNFINDLFLIVFKENLSSGVLNKISIMLHEIAQISHIFFKNARESIGDENESDHDDGDEDDDLKSKLFMEMLADFSRDIDNF